MRRSWISLVLAGICAASVAARSQTPAPPATAGDRYKSVRVLKDIPAAEIIPTMAFMANSLGVTCAHCHTDDWASDDKPMKEKARTMIVMMRAINAEQFGGRTAVTCVTCHNGHAQPAVTPRVEDAGWNQPAQAPAPPLPQIADVFEDYERAVGLDAYPALTSRSGAGTVTRYNGRVAPASAPFTLEQAKEPPTAKLTTDLSHPPEADAELNATFVRPLRLRAGYRDAAVTGRARVRDREAIVVTARNAAGAEHRLYFDAATHLLLRRTDDIPTSLGRVPENYDFDDYRRVDGVMVPFKVQWSRADYQVTYVFASVKHNGG
jgi:hypothetical protein